MTLTRRQKILVAVFFTPVAAGSLAVLCVWIFLWVPVYRAVKEMEDEHELKARLEAAEALPRLKRWVLERIAGQPTEGLELGRAPPGCEGLGIQYVSPFGGETLMAPSMSVASAVGLMASPLGSRSLAAACVLSVRHRIKYFGFHFGGGFRSYGLYIGPPGFTPDESWPCLSRWDESVWYYDEIPRKRH